MSLARLLSTGRLRAAACVAGRCERPLPRQVAYNHLNVRMRIRVLVSFWRWGRNERVERAGASGRMHVCARARLALHEW